MSLNEPVTREDIEKEELAWRAVHPCWDELNNDIKHLIVAILEEHAAEYNVRVQEHRVQQAAASKESKHKIGTKLMALHATKLGIEAAIKKLVRGCDTDASG